LPDEDIVAWRGRVLALKVIPISAAMMPDDVFRCEHYRVSIPAQRCVQRQTKEREAFHSIAHLAYCASGECAQGRLVALALKGKELQPPRQVNAPAQFAAKRRQEVPWGAGLTYESEPKQEREPAPPAEEREMAEAVETVKTCPLDGKKLRADNGRGWCTSHLSTAGRLKIVAFNEAIKKGVVVPDEMKPRGPNAAASEPKPKWPVIDVAHADGREIRGLRKPDPVAPAASDDVVELLQKRLQHHQAEAGRIQRALKALES
jgi:hypothetical protein